MYIVEINNNGTKSEEKFNCESDYNMFIQGMLFGLEFTDVKYTYREIEYQVEWITKFVLDILS